MDTSKTEVTFRGLSIPFPEDLSEDKRLQLQEGRYKSDEITGALSVIRPGDKVLELGTDLGVVSAVVANEASPKAVLSFAANPTRVPYIRAMQSLNRLQDIVAVRHPLSPDTSAEQDKRSLGSPGSFSSLPALADARRVETPTELLDTVIDKFRPDVLIMNIGQDALSLLNPCHFKDVRAVVMSFCPSVHGREHTKACKDRLLSVGFQKSADLSTRAVWTCMRNLVRMEPPSPAGGWSCQVARLQAPVVVPPTHRSHVQPTGVLTAKGQTVPHAATWRNARLLTLPPARPEKATRLPGRWVWGGVLWRYFPHFITESVTRLWVLEHIDVAQFDGILFTPKNPKNTGPMPSFQRAFLDLMGCSLPIHEARKPCVPDELIVPGQGFGLGQISRGTDRFTEAMALRFGHDVAPSGSEKLYISRSRLGAGRGALLGETQLEAYLEDEGYEIFHPQAHSLSEQVARYKAARQIIAAEGSALHFLAFVARPDQQIAMILRRRSSATQHISNHLESFSGRVPLCIETLRRQWMPEGEIRKRLAVGEPDFAAIQAALVTHGFITNGPVWEQPVEETVQAALGSGYTLLAPSDRLAG